MVDLSRLEALIGEDKLTSLFNFSTVFQPVFAALIGLIPNCAASVVLVDLYINGLISISSLIAGLCTGAGVGIIILFKKNKNFKY